MTYATPFIRFVGPTGERSAPTLQRLRALLAFIATLAGLWFERTHLRWELRRLAAADDHVLRDIGLTRAAALRASRLSLWP
jgi:uncharacterized protein YjiS (DUF1127 family)